jgi:hypothetical protein
MRAEESSRLRIAASLVFGLALATAAAVRAEFLVNTFTTGDHSSPSVAADGLGNFLIVWRSLAEVAARRFDAAGTPLGDQFQVNTATTGTQGAIDVAADAAGNFVVVWQRDSGPAADVFGQRFAADGSFVGGEFQVNSSTTGIDIDPSVTMDAAGNFVVVWATGQIVARRYDVNGAPLGPEFQVSATSGSYIPRSAVDAAGNLTVVWQAPDGDDTGIFARRYDAAGAPLGAQFAVNAGTTGEQTLPVVAADAAGNFVVAWEDGLAGFSAGDIIAQRYDINGMILGPEFQVNTYTTYGQEWPAIAADASGGFLIAWESWDLLINKPRVFAQRYDASGAPAGSEFPINVNFDVLREAHPGVAFNPAGTFVVAWEDAAVLYGSRDVLAQRNKPDRTIRGTNLVMRSPTGDEEDRVVTVIGKEPAGPINKFTNSAPRQGVSQYGYVLDGDPTVHGATLRVIANGATSTDETYVLDAAGWDEIRPRTSFRWRNNGLDPNPVHEVRLQLVGDRGLMRLKAILKGKVGTAPLAAVPPNPGVDAGIVLQIGGGGGTYCTPFGGAAGGDEVTDTAERWRIAFPTADPACPSP